MNKNTENLNREETIKMNQEEILKQKNKVSKIKIFIIRAWQLLEMTEERASELEGRSIKVIQFENIKHFLNKMNSTSTRMIIIKTQVLARM